jgi:hypothetical protein
MRAFESASHRFASMPSLASSFRWLVPRFNDRLTAVTPMHMLDRNELTAPASNACACGVCATRFIFLLLVTLQNVFLVPLSLTDNFEAAFMNQSSLIVLLAVTFGNMMLLMIGFFILWLAGEFGGSGHE